MKERDCSRLLIFPTFHLEIEILICITLTAGSLLCLPPSETELHKPETQDCHSSKVPREKSLNLNAALGDGLPGPAAPSQLAV